MGTRSTWTRLHTEPEPAATDSAWKSQCCLDFHLYFLQQQCHHAYMKYSNSFTTVYTFFPKDKSIGHRKEGMVCF